jgi:1-pyrroline-4-hydroxy-2-carboxylate deaminase
MAEHWSGVFPAVTTQFRADQPLDLPATGCYIEALAASAIGGLVACGLLGENQAMEPMLRSLATGVPRPAAARRLGRATTQPRG